MFIGSKTVEFQSERVWEWSLEELWCVICNGVVSVWDYVREVKKEMFRDMGSKIYVFSKYGEWDNEYKRVIVL